MTQYPLMGGVPLLEVTNVVFVCGWDHDSVTPYRRCPLTGGYKCSVCVWLGPYDSVSPYGRCPLTAGYKCSVCVGQLGQ